MTTTTKTCPKCGTAHKKPGKFCSRTCANSRQWTDEHKKKFSIAQTKYMASERAEEHLAKRALQMHLLHKAGLAGANAKDKSSLDFDEISINPDEYFLLPPDIDDAKQFVQDGDYWEEV